MPEIDPQPAPQTVSVPESLGSSPAAYAQPRPPRPVITLGLIAINVVIYVVMCIRGGGLGGPSLETMVRWGAMYGPLVAAGQWWRLLTACFLHFSILHIGFNMYVLYQVGLFTEPLFGAALYLLLYLAAGVGGNVIGLFLHPGILSAGASGAIFGVYGGLLGYLLVNRRRLVTQGVRAVSRSVFIFLAYNLAFGLLDRNTDLTAHIGGLVIGFLAGCVLAKVAAPLRRPASS